MAATKTLTQLKLRGSIRELHAYQERYLTSFCEVSSAPKIETHEWLSPTVTQCSFNKWWVSVCQEEKWTEHNKVVSKKRMGGEVGCEMWWPCGSLIGSWPCDGPWDSSGEAGLKQDTEPHSGGSPKPPRCNGPGSRPLVVEAHVNIYPPCQCGKDPVFCWFSVLTQMFKCDLPNLRHFSKPSLETIPNNPIPEDIEYPSVSSSVLFQTSLPPIKSCTPSQSTLWGVPPSQQCKLSLLP